jgi:hypothetical protein
MHVADTNVFVLLKELGSRELRHAESSHLRHYLRNLGPKGDKPLHLIGMASVSLC